MSTIPDNNVKIRRDGESAWSITVDGHEIANRISGLRVEINGANSAEITFITSAENVDFDAAAHITTETRGDG